MRTRYGNALIEVLKSNKNVRDIIDNAEPILSNETTF